MRIVHVGADAQNPAAFHGFETVLDHVVKRLLHLVAIDLDKRQVRAQFLFNNNVPLLNLRSKEAHSFLDNDVDIFGTQLRARWPNGAQKLGNDGIKPRDLGTRDIN